MTRKTRIPLTPTIVALVGLAISAFLMLSNSRATVVMKLDDFELQTDMVGFALLVAVLAYVAYIIRISSINGKRRRREIPLYDPRSPHNSKETIECYECGREMPRLQRVCPNCGHERPLY